MTRPKPGDEVTCLHAVEAYYSNYGPNKGTIIEFKPGMAGVVNSIAPKVTMLPSDERHDQSPDFLVVDYIDDNQKPQRVALNFCNAKVVEDEYEIVVKFKRSLSDDANVVEECEQVTAHSLRKQFINELQAAYNHPDLAIAGSFQVISGPTFH